jgi:hypothetical protein
VAFNVVPELLDRVEFGGIRRELFDMEATVGSLDLCNRRPLVESTLDPRGG